ncbi:MATE family efflux transporter [Clostridiaceae bacterium 68-1-5]|uniref:Probable multidrug resistance protein NorM n=1 Tax=Suipraeoptans intestinalis TaxID=2606628 RepID=A0A6N7UYS3_9FIRM|nr:MATE family efflux transporter [Suipraeoptans intestinalis]MSR93429.1 MATE family efflux transporter [Suipraeoptans intestinalis]
MKQEPTNKLGTMPVSRLMLSMGIPVILSMMLQAVYNIVDSAFVSHMPKTGELALNALTLAFPVQMLMIAIGIGTGVGANALLSKSIGQKEYEKASLVSGNALFLGFLIYLVFLLFGLFGTVFYAASQTDNPAVRHMVVVYLQICCNASFGIVFFSIFEKLLQATGRSGFSTIAQVSGALINVCLDPVLIYGWLGLPAMGVAGAAYATVIGQIFSALLGLIFHLRQNREIRHALSCLKPDVGILKAIYAIGLPAILAQALMSAMTYGMNLILGSISEAAVTAYGLYYKIQQFILFAAFGLRDAISAMQIISISFLFAGVNIAYQGIFQALDSGLASLLLSVLRQCLLVLPVAWGFSFLARRSPHLIWTVWTTFIIAEGLSFLFASVCLKRIYRTILSKLEESTYEKHHHHQP